MRFLRHGQVWGPIVVATVIALALHFVSILPTSAVVALARPSAGALTVGRLLVPRGNEIVEVDQQDGSERLVLTADGLVLAVATSSRSSELVCTVLKRLPGDVYAGADLYAFANGDLRPLVNRQGPDQELDVPSWTADGSAIIYQVGGISVDRPWIEYASVDGSVRQVLVRDAQEPTLSPDGALFAYVRADDAQSLPTHLIARSIAATDERELLSPTLFTAVRAPRFSPDGRQIAFLAVSGPSARAGPQPRSANLLDLFRPSIAYAHGPPWDVWTLDLASGVTRKSATLSEDDPSLAWAPDGQTIAVLGVNGLWLTRAGDIAPTRLGAGSVGRIEWTP